MIKGEHLKLSFDQKAQQATNVGTPEEGVHMTGKHCVSRSQWSWLQSGSMQVDAGPQRELSSRHYKEIWAHAVQQDAAHGDAVTTPLQVTFRLNRWVNKGQDTQQHWQKVQTNVGNNIHCKQNLSIQLYPSQTPKCLATSGWTVQCLASSACWLKLFSVRQRPKSLQ